MTQSQVEEHDQTEQSREGVELGRHRYSYTTVRQVLPLLKLSGRSSNRQECFRDRSCCQVLGVNEECLRCYHDVRELPDIN